MFELKKQILSPPHRNRQKYVEMFFKMNKAYALVLCENSRSFCSLLRLCKFHCNELSATTKTDLLEYNLPMAYTLKTKIWVNVTNIQNERYIHF